MAKAADGQYILFYIYLAASTLGSPQCVPYPITIPIGNVTLSNGQLERGVELGVRDPV